MNWKNKFANFMYGRYGVDQFSKFLLGLTFVLCLISLFVGERFHSLLNLFILASIIYVYYRMFSKNIYKRAAENEKYLNCIRKFKTPDKTNANYSAQKKYYKFFKCPGCGQKIRIPKGHGKIEIRCPKCNTRFIKRS